MRLFAIGDLHLPGGDDKPMDVFGPSGTGIFCAFVRTGSGLSEMKTRF